MKGEKKWKQFPLNVIVDEDLLPASEEQSDSHKADIKNEILSIKSETDSTETDQKDHDIQTETNIQGKQAVDTENTGEQKPPLKERKVSTAKEQKVQQQKHKEITQPEDIGQEKHNKSRRKTHEGVKKKLSSDEHTTIKAELRLHRSHGLGTDALGQLPVEDLQETDSEKETCSNKEKQSKIYQSVEMRGRVAGKEHLTQGSGSGHVLSREDKIDRNKRQGSDIINGEGSETPHPWHTQRSGIISANCNKSEIDCQSQAKQQKMEDV